MISNQLVNELNKQMNFEFLSSHVYMAMGAYCLHENLDGFANFFIVQAEEERFHAMKFFKFLNDIGQKAEISGMDAIPNGFTSVLDCYEKAYAHEKEVTKRIYHLSDIALTEREHATIHFLKWFIDEQVEEESLFDSIIHKLKRIDDDSNAFFMMDTEFASRKFVAPSLNE
ncbi:ferritin [Longirhabdus pacifica]|uniref:ferritin n=1 Tax=Longirhabdus pacifica TaxID=2305227 RepID=UPI001008BFDD|nr:ferritin [Longirhabdus pacifica]